MGAEKMLDGAGPVLGTGFRTEFDSWEGSRGEAMTGRARKVEDMGLWNLKRRRWRVCRSPSS